MNTYSLKKGVVKGVVSGLTVLVAMVAFTSFSDMTVWSLLEQYLKPLLGALTISGVLTMLLNYVKVQFGGFGKMLGLRK